MTSRLLLVAVALPGLAAELAVPSPSRQIEFRLNAAGRLEFSVRLKGQVAIEPSPLGVTVDGVNLSEGALPGRSSRRPSNDIYGWLGAHATARSVCNDETIPVKKGAIGYTLEVRACNDGVAFRHVIPGSGQRVPGEATAFRIPADATVWYHDLEGHYEGVHQQRRMAEIPAGQWAAPPVTAQLARGGGYLAITEGGLVGYAGMALQADGKGALAARLGHEHPPSYPFRLRYKDDIDRVSRPAAVEGEIATPWRVILLAADLNALVNSDLVGSVAPSSDPRLFPGGAATPWVRPGRAVWRYLDGGESTSAGLKEFSRMAGELGIEYQVVEGQWARWPEAELRDFIQYSRQQRVGIWLWKHTRDLRTPEERKQFFDLVKSVGAVGVKLDFFDHEAAEVVKLYEVLLREAAARQLLVNFHGANKPTGEARTWPNELTREAVRGMESKLKERARHDATLPFTRCLAGAADYTPMHFGDRRGDTTWAHQIATAVVFTSPLLTFAAHPASILENPARDLIQSLPSVWDETVVLPMSAIGEIAAFARRKQNMWYVAVVSGPAPKEFKVDLDFLGPGDWTATIVRDSPDNPAAVAIEPATLTNRKSLAVKTRPGGGLVARFTK